MPRVIVDASSIHRFPMSNRCNKKPRINSSSKQTNIALSSINPMGGKFSSSNSLVEIATAIKNMP